MQEKRDAIASCVAMIEDEVRCKMMEDAVAGFFGGDLDDAEDSPRLEKDHQDWRKITKIEHCSDRMPSDLPDRMSFIEVPGNA